MHGCYLFLTATLALCATGAMAQTNYYVKFGGTGKGTSASGAFGTIEQARDAIRARSEDSIKGDITVHIAPGIYFLKEPLTFDNRDSGRNGHKVTYQAQDPKQPTIISGGRRVTGPWQRGEKGVWSAPVEPSIFTQLYVNDRRATPSREPDTGWKELKQWEDRYGSKTIRLKGPDNLKREWQRSSDPGKRRARGGQLAALQHRRRPAARNASRTPDDCGEYRRKHGR